MRKPERATSRDHTEPAQSTSASSASSSSERGNGHKEPLPILKELHPWPISLLATFADCGTILSGSRAVGGAHIETSDFDLYQSADKRALIEVVSILNFARIQWHNSLLDRVAKDVAAFKLSMMPLEEINRLAKGVFLGSNHTSRDLEKYLESVLKRGKYYKKYKDLPGKFALALERCLSTKLEDNMIWIYEPKGDKDRCIRQLPPAIAEPFSELFTKLPKCSNVHNREQKIDIPDYKRIRELIPGKELIMEVENAWLAEGYPATMLRRWLRYKTINLAPWFRDKVETIVDIILHISPTESQPTNTETQFEKPYPWFKMLRGTLPNKNKVQLIIIPPKRKYRKRESGILSTVFSFYATHPMAFINGVIGGHIYHEPTSQEISWKLDFTDDLRQKHADESIVKMKERGWKFKDMDKHVRGRSILDGKTTQLTEYENIYKSALKHVGKGNEELPAMLDNYFRERLRAVETYTWLEENGRITEVNNVAERRLISPKSRGLLSKWVHDKLSGHVDVIPKDQWGARKLVRAKLDLWFGGYQQDRKDKLCHLL